MQRCLNVLPNQGVSLLQNSRRCRIRCWFEMRMTQWLWVLLTHWSTKISLMGLYEASLDLKMKKISRLLTTTSIIRAFQPPVRRRMRLLSLLPKERSCPVQPINPILSLVPILTLRKSGRQGKTIAWKLLFCGLILQAVSIVHLTWSGVRLYWPRKKNQSLLLWVILLHPVDFTSRWPATRSSLSRRRWLVRLVFLGSCSIWVNSLITNSVLLSKK